MQSATPHNRPTEPAGEPEREPATEHRVKFLTAGDLFFGCCSCGWMDLAPDQEAISLRALRHDLVPIISGLMRSEERAAILTRLAKTYDQMAALAETQKE